MCIGEKMKYIITIVGLSFYLGFNISIFTMNDSTSLKWGCFGLFNFVLLGILGLIVEDENEH